MSDLVKRLRAFDEDESESEGCNLNAAHALMQEAADRIEDLERTVGWLDPAKAQPVLSGVFIQEEKATIWLACTCGGVNGDHLPNCNCHSLNR